MAIREPTKPMAEATVRPMSTSTGIHCWTVSSKPSMGRGILTCDLRALKATTEHHPVFTAYFPTSYTFSMLAHRSPFILGTNTLLGIAVLGVGLFMSPSIICASDDLHIEMTNRGLGKEVVITQGARERFMLIEVTPENS